eukprot:539734_1
MAAKAPPKNESASEGMEMAAKAPPKNESDSDSDDDFPEDARVEDNEPVKGTESGGSKAAQKQVAKPKYKCPKPNCEKEFVDEDELTKHINSDHKK